MSYETWFTGGMKVAPPLNEFEKSYLEDFTGTRHTSVHHGPLVVESSSTGRFRGNAPQAGMPGIWCHWIVGDDDELVWDENEKTYDHAEWLDWIIRHLFGPESREFVQHHVADDPRLAHFTCDHVVNGVTDAHGEDFDDIWRIRTTENAVRVQRARIVYPDDAADSRLEAPASSA